MTNFELDVFTSFEYQGSWKKAVKYLKDNGEECIYGAGKYGPKEDHTPVSIGATAREKNNEIEKRLFK